ncbi:hypothetical protein KC360_g91 [Hortaea werneckii]|nr:hypothetical protein KC360_g91 [Hortaea werneckii]
MVLSGIVDRVGRRLLARLVEKVANRPNVHSSVRKLKKTTKHTSSVSTKIISHSWITATVPKTHRSLLPLAGFRRLAPAFSPTAAGCLHLQA